MYLHDLSIRNVGPIKACEIKPEFTESGDPKPVLIVGQNGSGKTIVLSAIADAIILMASEVFTDVAPSAGLAKAFFRVTGQTNQMSGSKYSSTLMKFGNSDQSCEYIERTGSLDPEVESVLSSRFPKVIGQSASTEPFSKTVSGFNVPTLEEIFLKNSNLYFPATRQEMPHWQNSGFVPDKDFFMETRRFKGQLGKAIISSQTLQDNSKWILEVILDSRIDIQYLNEQVTYNESSESLKDHLLFGEARKNINSILQNILRDESSSIKVYYRGQESRLYIEQSGGKIIPSLRHLSLGQSVLFNLFCSIIRSADSGDLNRGHKLHEIKGVVIIDEIESHLHETLRFEVLPSLIKLFPKVQFVITTHSPSFLLGMTKSIGDEGVNIIEMPTGLRITASRFSEFQQSIQNLKTYAEFDASILQIISTENRRPIVFTEGELDEMYIKHALETLVRQDLLLKIDIEWIGANIRGSAINAGSTALDSAALLLEANPYLINRPVLLLYDCDTKKQNTELLSKLWKRTIPYNSSNTRLNRGIENLLPDTILTDSDYVSRRIDKDYGGHTEVVELQKRILCERVTKLHDPCIFQGFAPIVEILESFLAANQVKTQAI